jgi:RimJ/RimL family protein N-acetyltransferase
VWINMTNLFPHPYTAEDARAWPAIANREPESGRTFAIDVHGEAVGGVGFRRQTDLSTKTAAIGYWLGETFWGQGLARKALQLATKHAFEHYDFERLQAGVLSWNPRSARVLEKCGYTLEGTLRRNIFKDGKVCDRLMYARLRA